MRYTAGALRPRQLARPWTTISLRASRNWCRKITENLSGKSLSANERWEQGNDGHWSKVSGNDSPWTAPEPVTFKLAPAQPDALHSEFRTGSWWTKAECDAVDKAPMLDEPPIVLPPLTRTRADCVATEPPMTAEQIARENRQPNRWKRHEEREKFRKEQEAAMLRGTFKWDVSEYQQK